MNFANVKSLVIPEGNVKKIHAIDRTIWIAPEPEEPDIPDTPVEPTYGAYPVFAPGKTWYKASGRYYFSYIQIKNSNPPKTYEEAWAADKDNTGSIMCYATSNTLYICGNGTGKLTANKNSSHMFAGFMDLDRYGNLAGLDLLDTSYVEDMSYMFAGNYASLDLGGFDTRNVKNMSYMFANRGHTTVDGDGRVTSYYAGPISNYGFNTQKVEDMSYMFLGSFATSYDLRDYNTSNVKTMEGMFYRCGMLNTILVSADNWVISSDCNTTGMFANCGTDHVTYI